MEKNFNRSLTILSAILGITAIACIVTLYINPALESKQIESIYIITLISIIGLISIHVRFLFKDIASSYTSEKKKGGVSEVTISKCFKSLYKHHEHILPRYILEKLYPSLA